MWNWNCENPFQNTLKLIETFVFLLKLPQTIIETLVALRMYIRGLMLLNMRPSSSTKLVTLTHITKQLSLSPSCLGSMTFTVHPSWCTLSYKVMGQTKPNERVHTASKEERDGNPCVNLKSLAILPCLIKQTPVSSRSAPLKAMSIFLVRGILPCRDHRDTSRRALRDCFYIKQNP